MASKVNLNRPIGNNGLKTKFARGRTSGSTTLLTHLLLRTTGRCYACYYHPLITRWTLLHSCICMRRKFNSGKRRSPRAGGW